MTVLAPPDSFDIDVETLIVGGGAAGMVASLAAHEAGQHVLVVEADAVPGPVRQARDLFANHPKIAAILECDLEMIELGQEIPACLRI